MPRYVCIHGHFYQPPRENPWLNEIELQKEIAPWHDWNEKINADCYSRNAASRILNPEGKIVQICNNYSRMSFNVGPTLLSWLEQKDPLTYFAILEADAIGRRRFSNHGPAIAQVYNHIIMPLANRRDKETQVKWGIADFKRRFNRLPEGMWLAETAVDTETLEVLAENGIKFTILSPFQAASVRPLGRGEWKDVSGGKIDTRHAYLCNLPSGRDIALFFYDGLLSQKIAFGGMLDNGEYFARQLIDAYPESGTPILSHVATDGESYGHHHDHGDMALAYCLETVDKSNEANLTVYGEFLDFYPPEYEVRIIENSSWSCAHGVERWRSDCGCSTGTAGFHQKWRDPLRKALNDLRDNLAELYEYEALKFFNAPWVARDKYIDVILNRANKNVDSWLKSQLKESKRELTGAERVRVLSLLEMQRYALLMFTSCGWFFDEISRIEPVQIMRYAACAMELAHDLFNEDFEPEFLATLEKAPSNVPELQNGAKIYDLLVKRGRVDMPQMAAYYGVASLLKDAKESVIEGCWEMQGTSTVLNESQEEQSTASELESTAFSAGTVHVRSTITGKEGTFLFAANHRGGTSLLCGVAPEPKAGSENDPRVLPLTEVKNLRMLFAEDNELAMVNHFGYTLYTLRHIPTDVQYRLLDEFLKEDIHQIEEGVRGIVKNYQQLLEYLTALDVRPPAIIVAATEIALTFSIEHALTEVNPDFEAIQRDLNLATQWQINLDREKLGFDVSNWLKLIMTFLCSNPMRADLVDRITDMITLFVNDFKWHLSFYDAQNLYYELWRRYSNDKRILSQPDVYEAILRLGRKLQFSDELLSGK